VAADIAFERGPGRGCPAGSAAPGPLGRTPPRRRGRGGGAPPRGLHVQCAPGRRFSGL